MRLFIKLLFIFTGIALQVQSQEITKVPLDNSPVIDGTQSDGEWSNSHEVSIVVSNNEEYKILFSHDEKNFNAIFIQEGGSAFPKFPEIMFDVNNDKSIDWMNDDWWFHVSAALCEYNGEPQNYDSCDSERANWNASKNSDLSIVEMQIPFNTLEVNSQSDTIGIAFDVTNTFNSWHYWPENADIYDPSTWETVYFQSGVNNVESTNLEDLIISPNPVSDRLKINREVESFQIFNLQGNKLMFGKSNSIDISKLEKGLYLIKITTQSEQIINKFIKY